MAVTYTFADFNVHLIHRKQVPLLHNIVMILCYEGDGLVGVYRQCFLPLSVTLTQHRCVYQYLVQSSSIYPVLSDSLHVLDLSHLFVPRINHIR